jgi:MYXO-CTERM domain-containing protein
LRSSFVFSPRLLALGAGVLLAVGAGVSACQPAEEPPAPESSSSVAPGPAVSPPFDVAAVVKRVGQAFRPASGGFIANQDTWQVRVEPDGTARFEPLNWREPAVAPSPAPAALERASTQVVTGAPLRVRTASVSRGGRSLAEGLTVAVRKDGALSLARGPVVEVLRNGDEGLEQLWELESRPEGRGALEVRVALSGLEYAGQTEHGHHFMDPRTRLGVRYGRATWVDAAGERTAVETVRDGDALVMRVPEAVLERSSWPAVLDPVISPEQGMDAPLPLPSANFQSGVDVAFGGGVYLVTWTHYGGSTTDYDVFAARVRASDGALLDLGSIAISATSGFEGYSSVASSGGEFLVVWMTSGKLLGVRVRASDGQVLDSAPRSIAAAPAAVRASASSFDGTNYFVVWEDRRASGPTSTTYDIYGARVRASDGVALDGSGIPLCVIAGDQSLPQVAFDGERFLVVWEDARTLGTDIYGARVRASDAGVLDPGGFAISNTVQYQHSPSVAFDGVQFLVVWEDGRNDTTGSNSDVFGARVRGANGVVLDVAGIPIAVDAAADQGTPAIASNGRGSLVAWTHRTASAGYDVYSARVGSDGAVTQTAAINATPDSTQQVPELATNGSDYLVAWLDQRASRDEVYAARVRGSDGVVLDSAGLLVSTDVNDQEFPSVAQGGGTYLVAWGDLRNRDNGNGWDIHGGRVRAMDGVVLGGASTPLSVASGWERYPRVASDGRDFLAVWSRFTSNPTGYDVYGVRVRGSDGQVLGSPFLISDATGNQQEPSVAFGNGYYLVTWSDARSDAGDIYAARVRASDGRVMETRGVAVSRATNAQAAPKVAFGAGVFQVAWADSRATGTGVGTELYGARVRASDGAVLDSVTDGKPLSLAPGNQTAPTVVFDGLQFLVAWADTRGGGSDLYGTRVGASDGVALDVAGRILHASAGDQGNPALTFDGRHHLLVWEETRSGVTYVRGARVTPAVEVLDAAGFDITVGASPSVASWGPGHSLVVYSSKGNGLQPRVKSRRVLDLLNGAPCTVGTECNSGFCADGVCCDSACGGGLTDDCQVCSVAAGGPVDGACSPVPVGAAKVCRAQEGPCDVAERCDGASLECPANVRAPAGTACRPGTAACDAAEACTGDSAECPEDRVLDVGVECRARAGDCDVAEVCDGASRECPADGLVAAGGECRPAAHACDAAETCSGSSNACPVDALAPDGTACDDGSACTQTDTCQSGTCTGTEPLVCTAPNPCMRAGVCDPVSGVCSPPQPVTDGTACDDGNACTQSDTCQAGMCSGASPVICAAGDACHVTGTCDPATGACTTPTPAPDGTACDDGNACTQTDSCQSGACTGAAPVVCEAPNPCMHAGVCDPTTGVCSPPHPVADGASCDDGNACTQSDTCQSGACTGADPVVCAAGDACHVPGACNPSTGQCSEPPPAQNGTACDDGNACTRSDSCQSGTCTGADPVVCTASDTCHAEGTCNPSTGVCSNPTREDGTTCSGGTCQTGECIPTPDAGTGDEDAGTEQDAGTDEDAGKEPDAGEQSDAGAQPDAGGTDADAGTEPDAGEQADAGGQTDAGEQTDAGPRPPVSVPAPEALGCGCGVPAGSADMGLLMLIAGAALLRRSRRQHP